MCINGRVVSDYITRHRELVQWRNHAQAITDCARIEFISARAITDSARI